VYQRSLLLSRDPSSSAMLCSVEWKLVNKVSGHSIGPIFRGQAVQEDLLGMPDL